MSQENVELVSRAFAAWLRGDDRWLDAIDPEIEWDFSAYPLPDLPEHGEGRENFARLLAEFRASWVHYENAAKELIDAGDEVVAVLHETIRARGSDVPLERDVAIVWTMREGRAVRYRAYRTREEALEAAGLRE
jgi:ketosteroid isomerase-like protein